MKFSTEKGWFIHNFISTLDDMTELKTVMKPPLGMALCLFLLSGLRMEREGMRDWYIVNGVGGIICLGIVCVVKLYVPISSHKSLN
jgi:hypothetical protein